MACRLTGAKPLFEPMWTIFNWTIRNIFQCNFNRSSNIYIKKCTWKCRLRNGAILSRPQCVNNIYKSGIWDENITRYLCFRLHRRTLRRRHVDVYAPLITKNWNVCSKYCFGKLINHPTNHCRFQKFRHIACLLMLPHAWRYHTFVNWYYWNMHRWKVFANLTVSTKYFWKIIIW